MELRHFSRRLVNKASENLRCVRPGFGLPPKHLESLLGQRIGRDAVAGTPMAWALLAVDSPG